MNLPFDESVSFKYLGGSDVFTGKYGFVAMIHREESSKLVEANDFNDYFASSASSLSLK